MASSPTISRSGSPSAIKGLPPGSIVKPITIGAPAAPTFQDLLQHVSSIPTDTLGEIQNGLDKVTSAIENYTQEGRAEHPVLARVGDVTRNMKDLLTGGQTPLGMKSGVVNNPVTQTIGLAASPEIISEDPAEHGMNYLRGAEKYGELAKAKKAAKAAEAAKTAEKVESAEPVAEKLTPAKSKSDRYQSQDIDKPVRPSNYFLQRVDEISSKAPANIRPTMKKIREILADTPEKILDVKSTNNKVMDAIVDDLKKAYLAHSEREVPGSGQILSQLLGKTKAVTPAEASLESTAVPSAASKGLSEYKPGTLTQ